MLQHATISQWSVGGEEEKGQGGGAGVPSFSDATTTTTKLADDIGGAHRKRAPGKGCGVGPSEEGARAGGSAEGTGGRAAHLLGALTQRTAGRTDGYFAPPRPRSTFFGDGAANSVDGNEANPTDRSGGEESGDEISASSSKKRME